MINYDDDDDDDDEGWENKKKKKTHKGTFGIMKIKELIWCVQVPQRNYK